MERKTPEELLREALVREGSVMAGLGRSEIGQAARISRASVEKHLDDARQSGNIDRIPGSEAIILRTELEIHANSRAMRTSLETSITELGVATRMAGRVRDQAAYREFSEGFSLPRTA